MFIALAAPLIALASLPHPALERDIVAELNFARQQPRAYAERLRAYRGYFRGKIVHYPGRPEGLRTQEGTRAVDEAIAFLEKQVPVGALSPAPLLARAADDHVVEQGPRGATGHIASDGSNPRDRVRRRGGGIYVAETITYGPPSAVEVVRQLIIDDGVPTRGHRRTVYADEMRFVGVKCGPHKVYRTMCVAEFARTATGHYSPAR
ncbi:CAP domain-containing protein [Sphingomonas sp. M1-B02]|uniref:CAP domain-containing protein n=1 Tax=Sphingomonas sp. M1-B02 TaxID=3114300 RepID=UPI00223F5F7C|nr:CAP domain-containing protein [Sphingomonas sp. S6-11]UZK66588.1 CAP domain-containing protein [Sphingomonas sp. S6-11]